MYIIKNALRCISRSKGRHILIGIIVLVIAVSACLGLSIRQAAETAKTDTLSSLSVTATISFDRTSMMKDMMTEKPGSGSEPPSKNFDRSQFTELMGSSSSLSLQEYQTYAAASTVKDFYYTLTVSLNGSDGFEPVSTDTDTDTDSRFSSGNTGDFGGMGGRNPQMMGSQNDFSIIGYSGEDAMTEFVSGTSTVTDGTVFDEGTEEAVCLISEELATFNSLSVGDTVTLTNPSNEEETYTLTVVGLYTNATANENSFSIMGSTSADPANQLYMSYAALQSIVEASKAVSETVTDGDVEYETAIVGSLSGTYVFADTDAYYAFEDEVRELGLEDTYTVSSTDIAAFESSLIPLNTLSTMAGYFLIVVLIIGAIILVVLNIFNVRERKYEIGVLTAMGMKKGRVAAQFLTEIFAVTMVAVILGLCVGAVCSVPVTNALLENQITSQESNADRIEQSFGRGDIPSGDIPSTGGDMGGGKGFTSMVGMDYAMEYVSEINAAMNFTVVLQMLGIAVLLTLVSGMVSMLFVMRYEPLRILANRD